MQCTVALICRRTRQLGRFRIGASRTEPVLGTTLSMPPTPRSQVPTSSTSSHDSSAAVQLAGFLKLPSQAACLKAASESGCTRLSSAVTSPRRLVGSCANASVRWCPGRAPNVGQRWSCRPVTHGLARKAHQPLAAHRASKLGQVEEALVLRAACACATHGRGVATLLEVLTSFAVPELAHALACAGP